MIITSMAITPTTTAVMALSGAPKRRSPRVASTRGAPARMKPKEGRKVNQVTTPAAAAPPPPPGADDLIRAAREAEAALDNIW